MNLAIEVRDLLKEPDFSSLTAEEKVLLAGRESCPPALLSTIALSEVPVAAKVALRNPALPVWAMREIVAKSVAHWKHAALWRNPSIPPEIFRMVDSREGAYSDRITLFPLAHPNCPVEILDKVSTSPMHRARAAVASNPKVPIYLALRLGEDLAPTVLVALARNPNTPKEVLRKLALLNVEMIQIPLILRRDGFGRRLDQRLSTSPSTRVRISVARATNQTNLLERLAFDSELSVRQAVASNLNASDAARVAVMLHAAEVPKRLTI